jgi:hypothetical protein
MILVTGFIAFKAGTFDKYLYPETNRPESDSTLILQRSPVQKELDSLSRTTALDSVENPTMLSTSKSLILIDQKVKFPLKDSVKRDSVKSSTKK